MSLSFGYALIPGSDQRTSPGVSHRTGRESLGANPLIGVMQGAWGLLMDLGREGTSHHMA